MFTDQTRLRGGIRSIWRARLAIAAAAGMKADDPAGRHPGRGRAEADASSLNQKGCPMSLNPERKQQLIKDNATKSGDTGSPEVQIAILTERINTLTEHFKTH
jgi:hypothetical protein